MEVQLHRDGCNGLAGKSLPRGAGWHAVLDWAAYHAPGADVWQAWRKQHAGRWKTLDVQAELRGWLASQPEEHRLQDLVRTVNIARSLRGIQREHPEVVAFREEFTKEMNTLIASSEVEISW